MSEKQSFYDRLEKWKDGSIRYVVRDKLGHFSKSLNDKFYIGQQVGVWQKEGQQKIVPEIDHAKYVKGDFYRASISLNVPINGTKTKPNYKNFTYVVVDLKENIDIKEMYEELIYGKDGIEEMLHYHQDDFWFDSDMADCDIQYPKPYSANRESRTFEGTDY